MIAATESNLGSKSKLIGSKLRSGHFEQPPLCQQPTIISARPHIRLGREAYIDLHLHSELVACSKISSVEDTGLVWVVGMDTIDMRVATFGPMCWYGCFDGICNVFGSCSTSFDFEMSALLWRPFREHREQMKRRAVPVHRWPSRSIVISSNRNYRIAMGGVRQDIVQANSSDRNLPSAETFHTTSLDLCRVLSSTDLSSDASSSIPRASLSFFSTSATFFDRSCL